MKNNTTDEITKTTAISQEKRINGLTQEFWGIEPTEEGDKVNAQRLIEQYIRIPPIRYAESGAYYKYLNKGVWEEIDDRHI